MLKLSKLALIYFTVRELQLLQILYFIYFRVCGFVKVKPVKFNANIKSDLELKLLAPCDTIVCSQGKSVCFLNKTVSVSLAQMDWNRADCSRLWNYNLHYFAYLGQWNLADGLKSRLIEHWIRHNPQGERPGWEPYTASLRIVNWVGYFAGRTVAIQWLESLFLQSRWLFANLERHILANHYFENIKALLFASRYFSSFENPFLAEVASWERFALRNLDVQLKEQFLTDGGHFERSPQYHLQMVKNCIELLYLLQRNAPAEPAVCSTLGEIIRRGLTLSGEIARPDGCIPLFNDSALDQTPSLAALRTFAAEVGIDLAQYLPPLSLVAFDDFGIYGVKTKADWLMIDCGAIGPKYQPGHSHCDLLSFELMLAGKMIVVDSGVYEYGHTALRRQQRSTQAHNTVSVKGLDQSQVWGAFRVAKRAQKLYGHISEQHKQVQFTGAYRGFFGGRGFAVHQRTVNFEFNSAGTAITAIRVVDDVQTHNHHHATWQSYLHIHPQFAVEKISSNHFALCIDRDEMAYLTILNAESIDVVDSYYSPEFGIKLPNNCIVMNSHCQCITYSIHLNTVTE